jgi:molecular chaperone GrpE
VKEENGTSNNPSEAGPSDQQKNDVEMTEREKVLVTQNEELLEKVKEIDDKFKRALAEGENTRVRMRKQIEDAKIFGIQGFCKDLLEVADVLEKALESVPKEELSKSESLKTLFTGVEMTDTQLQSVFRRHGLVKLNPIGEKFNPNDHHALFEAVEEGKEPGTVAVVTKIGYKLHDRTIRPAMVGVVKAP